jgi:hypothetical protein
MIILSRVDKYIKKSWLKMPRLTFIKKYGIILKKGIFKKQENKKMGRASSSNPRTWLRPYKMFTTISDEIYLHLIQLI